MKKKSRSNWRWALIALLPAICYGAGRLGQALAIPPGNVTPVWPPSGIEVAAVLLLGGRIWPALWLGGFLANIWAFFDTANPFSIALSLAVGSNIATGNVISSLFGAWMLDRSIFAPGRNSRNTFHFERARDVFKFVVFGAMASMAISATVGVTSLWLGGLLPGEAYGFTWLTWWLGDAAGVFTIAPLLLSWRDFLARKAKFSAWKLAEVLLGLIVLFGIGAIAFGGGYPMEYLLIPCMVWAAFRFGHLGASTAIFLASAMAIGGTVKGYGPFATDNLTESLLLLQAFVGAVTLTALVLAAVLTERQQANAKLREALEVQAELAHTATDQARKIEQTMQKLKQTQAQLVQTEKMSALGELVAGVAHEINNPMNFVYGNLGYVTEYVEVLLSLIELYQQRYPDVDPEIEEKIEEIELDFIIEDLPQILSSMKIGAERIREIVFTLKNFSRVDGTEMKLVNIYDGIESSLVILQHKLKAKPGRNPIQVIKEYGELPQVECYGGQLNQVFINIIGNAIDALQEYDRQRSPEEIQNCPSQIAIFGEVIEPDWVRIRINDNGPGIAEDKIEKLFEPFFTTKPVGEGTGLGLSISYEIVVQKHGGRLKCLSELGKGTDFIIEIPARRGHGADGNK